MKHIIFSFLVSLSFLSGFASCLNGGSNRLPPIFSYIDWRGGSSSVPFGVSQITPGVDVNGVSINTSIQVGFNRNLDSSSISNVSFQLSDGSTRIPGIVSAGNSNLIFTPSSQLASSTMYTVILSKDLKSSDGTSLGADFIWNFTTLSIADLTPPIVSLTAPIHSSVSVPVNTSLSVAFSETMNCSTLTTASFTLNDGSFIPGTVGCSSTSATFTPVATLSYNTTYTATITTAVKDLAGNPLAAPFVWTFTTGSDPDVTAPTVSIVNPIHSSVGVATTANVTVAFSEAIDCTSITTATFTLNNGSAVPGTVSCSGTSAVFTPSSILLSGTLYTATIQIGAKDLANNSIASAYNWSFTTGALPDTIPPGVSIQNLKNKSLVETGFMIGSASDAGGVALVEVSVDGGAYASASGTTVWNFKLPSGAATWSVGSQHTIAVRSKDSSGNLSAISSVQVRKGTNKDVNGDGYVDMVIGEYGQGIVYIFHSSGTSGIAATNASLANRYIVGLASDEFGKSVVLGDLNGDGYSDVIAGAPAANTNTGKVYAFYSTGNSGVNISFVSFASARIDGAVASERFGFALETGDLDGNGFTDLIVGAPYSSTNTGKVYTFHSAGASGILDTSATTAAAILIGSATNEFFGSSLAQGNINGDIYSDLVVGAYGYSAQKGRVSIYHGSSTGIGAVSSTLANTAGSGQFGFSVAVADVSGDGFGDLIAGAPFLNSAKGQVVVYVSSSTSAGILTSSGLSAANFIILGTVISDHLGNSIASRDLDLDGKADLILNSTPNAPAQGIVYVYMSPILSYTDTTTASLTMTGPMGDLYGWGLSTGDVNGDGYGDLYVGSPGYNNGNYLGRTFIFHSSGSGLNTNLPSSASKILDGSGLTGGSGNWFGRSLY
ncbi:Ig-like domain-containing protein [Leptospira adleri]|uniref:SbsA Ig-like domain-containing protein n=1 Tax=Leptospira adleri TaxID=2023186 RepID=A0A2M9YKU5_9LEPT|nr:Ig-like domain-containing protein [Leptospira adleri]PJZ52080.1 hypothetical protein CH380_16700 [Leptospira adleri]PJZ62942.1 hypothetical protein CH376_05480 [Leptospira adleri]